LKWRENGRRRTATTTTTTAAAAATTTFPSDAQGLSRAKNVATVDPTPQGYERHPEDLQGVFSAYTQALRNRDLSEEEFGC